MKQKIYIAALLAGMLALAGCGGGSSTVEVTPATVTAAQTAITAANTAVDALTATSDQVDVNAADGLITAAKEAIAKAPEGERATLTAMLADSDRQIAIHNDRFTDDGITPAQLAELCKADGVTVNDAGDGCIADTSIADQTKKEADYLAIFNALNGPIIGAAMATQTSFTERLVSGTSTPYTEADAKKQDDYKSASISAQGAKFSSLVAGDENDITSISDDDKTITLNATVAKDNVEFTGVSTGQQNTHAKTSTYDADGDSDTDPVIAFSASGKYRGVDGTYYCYAAACTSSVNNDGELIFAGTWVFVAGSKDAQLMVDDAVTYGWWTDTPTGGSLTAGLFSDREKTGHVDARYAGGGSATYKGEALGQYVMSADNFGAFTADATLTADFTGTNTLEGMINGFKDADGGDLTGWEVKLHKTNIAVDGTFSGTQTGAENARQARWNIGDKKGAAGNWQGALYGGDANKYPAYAAGEFSAQHGPTGRMIGAFGAELESN